MYKLLWPVSPHVITSPFGPRKRSKDGFHDGVDINSGTAGLKQNVRPSRDAKVMVSKVNPNGYGNYIVLEHRVDGLVFCTVYAHLSQRLVEKGEFVTTDDVIGITGNTGYSKGVHLHEELREGPYDRNFWKKTNGKYNNAIDPVPYLCDELIEPWKKRILESGYDDPEGWIKLFEYLMASAKLPYNSGDLEVGKYADKFIMELK